MKLRQWYLPIIILLIALPDSSQALPDLVINAPRAKATVEYKRRAFDVASCAYDEGCIRTVGNRKLLLLDVNIKNVGNSDLEIGDPAARPELFAWSDCHGHYHLNGLATYRILTPSGRQVARTYKQGFCLRDDEPNTSNVRPRKYTCEFQGISAGWQDSYDKSLDCQWVDVTGIPAGTYNLEIRVNTQRALRESNYSNNRVLFRIRIPRR
ncbi:MAG TPA: lysyl oxidase family protein [Verrucomicrobiae bacterium]|nr:lysyl oxidase family protein [Verrucomicrobiae bacterium]